MPRSGTGISAPESTAAGFTLLEVMVVLVLVGILATFATLGVRTPGPQERLADEAQRLAASIELARQDALLLGELRGIRFQADGYALFGADDDQVWLAGAGAKATLPAGMDLRLEVEGRTVSLDTDDGPPQVLLMPSGEATEFSVEISADRVLPYRVSMDLLGRVDAREIR